MYKIIKFKNLVEEHGKIPLGTLKLWKLELMKNNGSLFI